MEGRVWIEDENEHHMLEKHRGNMWALAAHTPQAYKHAHESHVAD